MEVQQIHELVNTISKEVLGQNAGTEETPAYIVAEDLSNVIDLGTEIFNANQVDNYVKSLIDKIGKVIFVDRMYSGSAPSVLRTGFEYGAVIQKIACDLPVAKANPSWDLTDGATYSQDKFVKPNVSSKFFNSRNTFEIQMSIAERQVKTAFNSGTELNAFISMIQNSIQKAMTIRVDSLIMRTISNMIGQTLLNDFPAVSDGDYSNSSSNRAVNLLKLYNDKFTKNLTAEQALTSPEFIRFASFTIGLYIDRMSKISTLFNVGGKPRFTPKENLHAVFLSDFMQAAGVYLQSDTFHNEFTALPRAETVPFWQGSGDDYSFGNVSDIHVNVKDDDSTAEIATGGIIGVLFDTDALGVCNENERVRSHVNDSAEFINYWYKWESSFFNDLNENFIVFFLGDAPAKPTPTPDTVSGGSSKN